MTIHEILKKFWGYDTFRPLQEDVIHSVLQGNDILALLPTGGGKSICFQVPAMAMEGICVVVSPLIALMKDQVEHLTQKGISAAALYSGMNRFEIEQTLNKAVYERVKFLYVSPERLKSDVFIAHFQQMKVALIVVDEAHCISQWGYDFRPPYLEIANIRAYQPQCPVIALTATATEQVVKDICSKLLFKPNSKVWQKSFYRENLAYMVFNEEDKLNRLLRIIKATPGCGLVYVRSRRRTQEIAEFLQQNNISAGYYHAGLLSKERDFRQQLWMQDKISVMVATNAFGMGIDKPDVRFVVHLDLPESPEAYFQEAGRAGRDEKRAYAVMLFNNTDIANLETQYQQSFPELKFIKNVYQAVCNYYQVPVGSGQDVTFDFDIIEISRNYNLNPVPTFSALKFLEKEGYFYLPEREEQVSKVYIPLNKEQIYIFQVENPRFDNFLKLLLRSYGGLFSGFVNIYEGELSKRIGSTEESVSQVLELLDKQEIIVYKKKTKNPQIIFASNRAPVENVSVSPQCYDELKSAAEQRKKAIINYATSNVCRNITLLNYFDEKQAKKCGHCDVCLLERKANKQEESIEQSIIACLKVEPLTIRQLAEKIPLLQEQELLKAVEKMLDNRMLKIDSSMKMNLL